MNWIELNWIELNWFKFKTRLSGFCKCPHIGLICINYIVLFSFHFHTLFLLTGPWRSLTSINVPLILLFHQYWFDLYQLHYILFISFSHILNQFLNVFDLNYCRHYSSFSLILKQMLIELIEMNWIERTLLILQYIVIYFIFCWSCVPFFAYVIYLHIDDVTSDVTRKP